MCKELVTADCTYCSEGGLQVPSGFYLEQQLIPIARHLHMVQSMDQAHEVSSTSHGSSTHKRFFLVWLRWTSTTGYMKHVHAHALRPCRWRSTCDKGLLLKR